MRTPKRAKNRSSDTRFGAAEFGILEIYFVARLLGRVYWMACVERKIPKRSIRYWGHTIDRWSWSFN